MMSNFFNNKSCQFYHIKLQIDNFFKVLQNNNMLKDFKSFQDMYSNQKIGFEVPKFSMDNYMQNYYRLLKERKYAILLRDESMITMNYDFDSNGNVISHNLSFIPSIPDEIYIEEEELEADEKLILYKSIMKYMRVDYEPMISNPILHSNVHFHFGIYERDKDSIIKNVRLTYEGIVYPYDFLYIIFKYYYNMDDIVLTDLHSYSVSRERILLSGEEDKLVVSFKRDDYT